MISENEKGQGKVAVVGVVGRTNAGKSTLVNALVGEKVSIVSPVEQTTRNTIRGIVADPRGQLVLLDTPGLHKAVGGLGRILNRMARRSAAGTDITCVVFDASQEPQLEDVGWMQRVANENPGKVVFVLNKADRSPFREEEFRAAWEEAEKGKREEGRGKSAEEGTAEPVWVKSIATTEGGAKAVLLAKLHQEVPHEIGVLVKSVKDEGSRWKVDAEVLVNRPSQKPIVIGRGAETVKYVRTRAERDLSETFGVKVALELWVRVEPGWMKNDRLLAEMGYLGELV